MKTILSLCAVVASATLLTQCASLKSGTAKATDLLLGGPPVTKNTKLDPYYKPNNKASHGLNSIAAKVDGSVVTQNELNFILSPIREQLKAQFPNKGKVYHQEYAKAKKQIFQDLIDRELILNEFSNLGAAIPAREIDREVQNRINTQYNGKRSLYLADLKKNGLSQAKFRTLVERGIVVQAMKAQHFTSIAPPTTAELQKEYSTFSDKLRDITKDKAAYQKIWLPISTDELGVTPQSQLELANKILKDLKKGASFSALAKEHSQDAYSDEGGQWPLTSRLEFPVHFAPVVFQAPVGKVIGPLQDRSGFHIIKVTKRVNGPSPALSKVRPQLENRVRAEKSAARFNRWIKRLRNKAKIIRYS